MECNDFEFVICNDENNFNYEFDNLEVIDLTKLYRKELVVNSAFETKEYIPAKDEYYGKVTVNAIEGGQDLVVGSTDKQQTFIPEKDTFYQKVTVNEIDPNLVGSAIPRVNAKTYTPTTENQVIKGSQYITGDQTILGDPNLIPSNIVNGKSIFGVKGSYGTWKPNADMIWAKEVCEKDSQEGYTYKVLHLIGNQWDTSKISIPTSGLVKTSDGKIYTNQENVTHIWDKSKDIEPKFYKNIKLRWIIVYYVDNWSLSILDDAIYSCIDGLQLAPVFSHKRLLQYFDIINVQQSNYYFMGNMFFNCSSLKAIPQLDTSQVTDMSYMFYGCYALENVPQLDTSQVTNMNSMFYGCYALENVPQLDTSQVTNMNSMFYGCRSLETIPLLDTSQVTDISNMVGGCYALKTIPQLDTSQVTTMYSMFSGCHSLENVPLLDTSQVTDISYMFSECYILKAIPLLDTSQVTNMNGMFSTCSTLKTIPLLDTSQVTTMSSMFYECSLLETIPQLNTGQVTDMSYMFYNCFSLKTIPQLNTSKVTNMSSMFSECYTLESVELLDLSQVTEQWGMFSNNNALKTVKLLNINTNLSFSTSSLLTKDSIINGIIANLVDLTGQSRKTLDLGYDNLQKLSDAEKQVAIDKNWDLM